MRPAGRIAAAIEVLADMAARHRPVSEALKDWGLSHRFAGAGDRAAIGNLVYDALRKRSSIAWRMDGDEPWRLAVGAALIAWNIDPAALNATFAGDAHAPPPLPDDIVSRLASVDIRDAPDEVRADLPAWIAPHVREAFGDAWVAEGEALAGRPPLDLRVNALKASREKVAGQMTPLGVEPTRLSPVGLRIAPTDGVRRHPNVQAEEAFGRGRIEVQDEGSQLCALLVGAKAGEQVLDLCAGAGGKALALAAAMGNRGQIFATDSDRTRLAPIYDRLKRADVRNVQVRQPRPGGLDDLAGHMDRVLVDAPCTGSGIWRRRPDSKWRITPEAVERRTDEQDRVLAEAAPYVRPGGLLAYVTCSMLKAENDDRIAAFLAANANFETIDARAAWGDALPGTALPTGASRDGFLILSPRLTDTDGFFMALLRRNASSATA